MERADFQWIEPAVQAGRFINLAGQFLPMPSREKPKALLMPALLVGLAGLLWLAQETGWMPGSLPLGPVSVLVVSLAMIRYAYG